MTDTAISSILSVMLIFMTRNTLTWRSFVHAITVTFRTAYIGMLSNKREAGIVVVEGRITPATGTMACTAIRAELSIVLIPGSMTGVTVRWRALIHAIGMTCTALRV